MLAIWNRLKLAADYSLNTYFCSRLCGILLFVSAQLIFVRLSTRGNQSRRCFSAQIISCVATSYINTDSIVRRGLVPIEAYVSSGTCFDAIPVVELSIWRRADNERAWYADDSPVSGNR